MGKQTIYLAGDSTMADYPPKSYPMQGWGNKLHLFIPDSVRVVNKAVCGRSSKSFIEEGRLEEILQMIKPGDYLFIQFGHNDSKEDAERHTSPWSTYHRYLRNISTERERRGLIPSSSRLFAADILTLTVY